MIYDSLTLAACVQEMQPVLTGMIVHKVRQPNDITICLVCRRGGRQAEVLLSAHPRFARAHLTAIKERVPQTPPGFCQLLRKYLEGQRITGLEQIGFDRILRIGFSSAKSGGTSLVHEIMGKHSNIILVSADRHILGAIKIIGHKLSRVRQILPGQEYTLPPASKQDPRTVSPDRFDELWAVSFGEARPEPSVAAKWLVSTFNGISPILADEVIARAQATASQDIYASLSDMITAWAKAEFSPVLIHQPGKPFEEVYPLPLSSVPAGFQHRRPGISESLEATVRAESASAALEAARQEALRSIAKALTNCEQDYDDILDIIAHPELGQELRQKAEILSASFNTIPAGATEVTLPDYYDPEMKPVVIALCADLSPKDNIQHCFRLARKADDRLKSAHERLPEISASIQRLRQASEDIQKAATLDEIKERKGALENASVIRHSQEQQHQEKKERPFGGHKIRSVTSSDGLEILFGETADANDWLTTKIARPDDVWLHARAVTGAHVVIKTAGVRFVPPRTLNEAADIAVRNSNAKHSSYVPVDWTLRKHVRKPRKAAAGLVTYTHEKTIHVMR